MKKLILLATVIGLLLNGVASADNFYKLDGYTYLCSTEDGGVYYKMNGRSGLCAPLPARCGVIQIEIIIQLNENGRATWDTLGNQVLAVLEMDCINKMYTGMLSTVPEGIRLNDNRWHPIRPGSWIDEAYKKCCKQVCNQGSATKTIPQSTVDDVNKIIRSNEFKKNQHIPG